MKKKKKVMDQTEEEHDKVREHVRSVEKHLYKDGFYLNSIYY